MTLKSRHKRKQIFMWGLCFSLSMMVVANISTKVQANELSNDATVTVTDQGTTPIVDPENPGQEVIPTPGASTSGSLRFDYVSKVDFGRVPIKEKDRKYFSKAQYFDGIEEPRGFFIQISDRRSSRNGWTLQVKQSKQFQSDSGKELRGAVLSFDKGWINMSGDRTSPDLSADTVRLDNLDQAYQVAHAPKGTGNGIWSISFGASPNNSLGQAATMVPVVDKDGKQLIDPTTQKLDYTNNAVSLNIPEKTKIYPEKYHTELIWILSKLP